MPASKTGANRAGHKPEAQSAAACQKVPERCASRASRHDCQPVPGLGHLAETVEDELRHEKDHARRAARPRMAHLSA